nr:WG repeat-containing protein [Acidobacteriota bacterium]
GKMIIKPKFNGTGGFSEGLALVDVDYKFGFIDKTGKIVIKPMYDAAGNFSNGITPVQIGSMHGYIDKTGKYIWEMRDYN